jgi:hypothetical protein
VSPLPSRRAPRLAVTLSALTLGVAGLGVAATPASGAAAGAGQLTDAELTQQVHDAALDAYVIGYPLVVMRRTEAVRTCEEGVNGLIHSNRLFTSEDRDVVTPNNDTIYTDAWLDLRPGPQRITLPPASDRYYSLAFLDAYTGVFEVAHPGDADLYVVGPDWHGKAPAGVRVVHAPTNDVWGIGRTFVNGPDDLQAAQAYQHQASIDGPEGTPVVPEGTDCSTLPTPQEVDGSLGAGFFDELETALKADPVLSKDERTKLKPLFKLGHGAGDLPGADSSPAVLAGLESAVTDAQAQIDARSRVREHVANGWSWSLGHGLWGTDYLRRAMVTKYGLGALPASEAIYYRAAADTSGKPLTGGSTYRLHLAAGQMPPADAFWSVTMYDAASRMLVDNPIDRYAINSASPDVVRNADGSLDLYLQHDAPAGHESNWLPAPAGGFYVILRAYVPQPAALDGSWTPPALEVGAP